MSLIDLGPTSLYVREVGDGPPCLVLHGGPGLHHGTVRPLDPLADGRRLVMYDHRGHGRSGPLPEGPVDLGALADDAVLLADHLGFERFDVLGHSFGGWVGMELALRHPDRVHRLVLVATMPGGPGEGETLEPPADMPPPEVMAVLMGQPQTNEELIELYTAVLPIMVPVGDPAAVTSTLVPDVVSAESMPRVFAAGFQWSVVDRLADISCPTLVVAGGKDIVFDVKQHERIAQRIPDASLVVLEASGHFPWLDEPEPFFAAVDAFLRP